MTQKCLSATYLNFLTNNLDYSHLYNYYILIWIYLTAMKYSDFFWKITKKDNALYYPNKYFYSNIFVKYNIAGNFCLILARITSIVWLNRLIDTFFSFDSWYFAYSMPYWWKVYCWANSWQLSIKITICLCIYLMCISFFLWLFFIRAQDNDFLENP